MGRGNDNFILTYKLSPGIAIFPSDMLTSHATSAVRINAYGL